LKNDLKRAAGKAKKEYLKSTFDKIKEFKKNYDLVYVKKQNE